MYFKSCDIKSSTGMLRGNLLRRRIDVMIGEGVLYT
jgi:hypothetical protein